MTRHVAANFEIAPAALRCLELPLLIPADFRFAPPLLARVTRRRPLQKLSRLGPPQFRARMNWILSRRRLYFWRCISGTGLRRFARKKRVFDVIILDPPLRLFPRLRKQAACSRRKKITEHFCRVNRVAIA